MVRKKYPNFSKKQHKKRYDSSSFFYNTVFFNQPFDKNLSNTLFLAPVSSCIIPRSYISFFRKHFRKFLKKKKIICFFKLKVNYTISSKNKNARMGKGVGGISRFTFNIKKNQPFIILKNCGKIRVNLIARYLTKRLNTKVINRRL